MSERGRGEKRDGESKGERGRREIKGERERVAGTEGEKEIKRERQREEEGGRKRISVSKRLHHVFNDLYANACE